MFNIHMHELSFMREKSVTDPQSMGETFEIASCSRKNYMQSPEFFMKNPLVTLFTTSKPFCSESVWLCKLTTLSIRKGETPQKNIWSF